MALLCLLASHLFLMEIMVFSFFFFPFPFFFFVLILLFFYFLGRYISGTTDASGLTQSFPNYDPRFFFFSKKKKKKKKLFINFKIIIDQKIIKKKNRCGAITQAIAAGMTVSAQVQYNDFCLPSLQEVCFFSLFFFFLFLFELTYVSFKKKKKKKKKNHSTLIRLFPPLIITIVLLLLALDISKVFFFFFFVRNRHEIRCLLVWDISKVLFK